MIQKNYLTNGMMVRLDRAKDMMNIARKQAEDDERMTKELMEGAPESLRTLLEDNMAVTLLLQYGRSSFKFNLSDRDTYPKTMEQLRNLMVTLKNGWGGCINYSIKGGENSRIQLDLEIAH